MFSNSNNPTEISLVKMCTSLEKIQKTLSTLIDQLLRLPALQGIPTCWSILSKKSREQYEAISHLESQISLLTSQVNTQLSTLKTKEIELQEQYIRYDLATQNNTQDPESNQQLLQLKATLLEHKNKENAYQNEIETLKKVLKQSQNNHQPILTTTSTLLNASELQKLQATLDFLWKENQHLREQQLQYVANDFLLLQPLNKKTFTTFTTSTSTTYKLRQAQINISVINLTNKTKEKPGHQFLKMLETTKLFF
jgi:hypothetical protein